MSAGHAAITNVLRLRSPACEPWPPFSLLNVPKNTSDCSQIGLRPGWRFVGPPEPRPLRASVHTAIAVLLLSSSSPRRSSSNPFELDEPTAGPDVFPL